MSNNDDAQNSSNITDKPIDKYQKIIEDNLIKFFEKKEKEKDYESDNSKWASQICEIVTTDLYPQFNSCKLIAICDIIQKGEAPFFFESFCLWDPNTDYRVFGKYKGEEYECFVVLYIIAL